MKQTISFANQRFKAQKAYSLLSIETMLTPTELKTAAQQKEAENRQFFAQLKRKTPKNLDELMQKLHDEAFEQYNCLECAHCCSTISPAIYHKDIDRMAKALRIKPSAVVEKYLIADNDDFVFTSEPCPFLMTDNYCLIYENRPKACREYPHTDRKRFYQILDITLKNTYICPIVFEVVENLKKKIKI